jgi:spermidine/putrescine-binding protein
MSDRRKALRVLTWPDYVIDDVAKMATDRSGYEIQWETFDQNEDAYDRLKRASDSYDVIFADGAWPRRYLADGLVQPLDPSAFSSWDGVDEVFQERCPGELWPAGPGRTAAYPGNWGLRGVVWDPRRIGAVASWLDLWDVPDLRCWVNSQGSEVIAETALALGIPASRIYELDKESLGRITGKLIELSPRIGGVWSAYPQLADAFEVRGAWIAEVHTTALASNLEWALGRQVKAVVPKEGTVAYIDGAMVSSASHAPAAAAAFIDTMFSPDGIELQWRRSDGYASTNRVAMDRLKHEPRFREKIERAAGNPDAVFQAVLYQTPRDIDAYLSAWRTVLQSWRPDGASAG